MRPLAPAERHMAKNAFHMALRWSLNQLKHYCYKHVASLRLLYILNLEAVSKAGINKSCGLIVNSSRAIIYADNSKEFAKTSSKKAYEIKEQMTRLLDKYLS